MQINYTAPFWFDGAFGTYYFSLTGDKGPCELANLQNAAVVRQIHQEYIEAGVDAIKTNTFGANLQLMPDRNALERLLAAGYQNAMQAAQGSGARVFADIGGIVEKDADEQYRMIAECFCALGAKAFLFETLGEFLPLLPALRQIHVLQPDAFVLVSFAVSQDGFTRRGLSYRTLLEQAAAAPEVDALGLNCVCGPGHLVTLLQNMPRIEKPLSAMPNAGYPSSMHGRMFYEDNAAYFAGRLTELYQAGADILGGCCGSTPRHIAMGKEVVSHAERRERQKVSLQRTVPRLPQTPPDSRKLIAVELDPPQDCDCSWMLAAARELREAGADLFTIADSPLSRARADSVMTAAILQRETGAEAMPHLACRDRNQIALKASLLGAAMEGIHRVLVITGDPPAGGEGGVFWFNSYGLIRYIDQLNRESLAQAPLEIAAAINVNALQFDVELERARKKLDCGASVLLSQPIFSNRAADHFRRAKQALGCRMLAGILPVAGYKNALFLANEVSGIEIPSEMLERLQNVSPEQAAEISVDYSRRMAELVFDAADGFYIMTPLRKANIVRGLIRAIRMKEETKSCY